MRTSRGQAFHCSVISLDHPERSRAANGGKLVRILIAVPQPLGDRFKLMHVAPVGRTKERRYRRE